MYDNAAQLRDIMSRYQSLQELEADVLFHGTSASIAGELRGGLYDGVLWTTTTPDVAQTYIPDAGITTLFRKPDSYDMNRPISTRRHKDDISITLLEQMGYKFDVLKEDNMGIVSFRISKDDASCSVPTAGEMWAFLTRELEYVPNHNDSLRLKLSIGELGRYNVLPATYSAKGNLFIIFGASKLKIANISKGESDLTDLQYHKLDIFRHYEDMGYDGIMIDDFAQTENYGNVGHTSIGLFPSGIKKVEYVSVEATHHEWGSDFPLHVHTTKEVDLAALYEGCSLIFGSQQAEGVEQLIKPL